MHAARSSASSTVKPPNQRLAASIAEAAASGLNIQTCHLCTTRVVWCSTAPRPGQRLRPVSVEIVELGAGDVAITTNLFHCAGQSPSAYRTSVRTRFRMHGPHCTGTSHVGAAPARKVRP